VCVCVCVHIDTYEYIHHAYIHTYIHAYICMYTYTYVCMYTHTYTGPSALGDKDDVVPIPRTWLRPVDRGGVYASVYPTTEYGGISAARAVSFVLFF
jgi:hypothetical protein